MNVNGDHDIAEGISSFVMANYMKNVTRQHKPLGGIRTSGDWPKLSKNIFMCQTFPFVYILCDFRYTLELMQQCTFGKSSCSTLLRKINSYISETNSLSLNTYFGQHWKCSKSLIRSAARSWFLQTTIFNFF
jgi:hypothetical protein